VAAIEQSDGDEGAPAQPGGRGTKGEALRIELSRRERSGARRVAESKATVPHLYVTRTLALEEAPADLTASAISACAGALRAHPRLNSSYRDGEIEEHGRINVGFTVESEDGPLVPIVFDADKKDVSEIESELSRLSRRARDGALTSPELSGGTFTISALASGADSLLPAVVPGQSAHLAVGRPREAAIARSGEVRAGHALDLTLACDHRAVRPPNAAAFLEQVASALEGPAAAGL
jgi:pyruvate dehydrogenase E2 component (dihydrolipoamide acetyltransferase)